MSSGTNCGQASRRSDEHRDECQLQKDYCSAGPHPVQRICTFRCNAACGVWQRRIDHTAHRGMRDAGVALARSAGGSTRASRGSLGRTWRQPTAAEGHRANHRGSDRQARRQPDCYVDARAVNVASLAPRECRRSRDANGRCTGPARPIWCPGPPRPMTRACGGRARRLA